MWWEGGGKGCGGRVGVRGVVGGWGKGGGGRGGGVRGVVGEEVWWEGGGKGCDGRVSA